MIIPDQSEILLFRNEIEQKIISAQNTIRRHTWFIQVLQEICPHDGVERVDGQDLNLLKDCPYCGKKRAITVG